MKLGQFFKKMVGGSVILAALACPIFTSCYDDSKLWNEMDKLNDRVTSLEEKLNSELAALQYMLGADAAISEVKWNKTAGKWEFKLADGSTLDFVPPTTQNLQSLITTVELEGVKYWATYGADGTASAITDEDGNKYPVSVTPQVKTENGVTYLSLDGENWVATSPNPAVFADVEVVYTDNYTDEEEADWAEETPMYAIFTLADGSTITLTLDGVGMISFVKPSPYGRPMPLSELFIAKGTSFEAVVQLSDVTELIFSVPTGWTVNEGEITSDFMGTQCPISIVAPSAESVESMAAAKEGYIKVIGVCEGGKTITSKLFVSCSPFGTFKISKNIINITEYYGWDKMFYGITEADAFDKDAIMSTIMTEMSDPDNWRFTYDSFWAGDFYEPVPVESKFEDFTFTDGEKYIFWTVPVMMNPDTYAYYCVENSIESCEFTYQDVTAIATNVSITDIDVKVEMKGVQKYFAGFVSHAFYNDGFNMDVVLEEFNYCLASGEDYYYYPTVYTYSDVYEGSVQDLINVSEGNEILPNTTYTLWVAPYVEGKTSYSLEELYTFEFSTSGLSFDETVTLDLTCTNETPDNLKYNAIHVAVKAEDAALLYYCWVNAEDFDLIENPESYVLENGMSASAQTLATVADLYPGVTKRLMVLAVNSEGKYGKVVTELYTTAEYAYNSLQVAVATVGEPSIEGTTVSFTSEGATKYLYWAGLSDDNNWLYTFGGDSEKFAAFVAMNPEYYSLVSVNGENAANIVLPTDEYGNYVVAVVAIDANNTVSHATVYEMSIEYSLGNFVAAKDDNGNDNAAWLDKKPVVTIETDSSSGEFTSIDWTVGALPEGFTAYTGVVHPDNFTDYPTGADKAKYLLSASTEYIVRNEVVADEEYSFFYGSAGYIVYVILKDADGNIYEPYFYDCGITGGGGFGV